MDQFTTTLVKVKSVLNIQLRKKQSINDFYLCACGIWIQHNRTVLDLIFGSLNALNENTIALQSWRAIVWYSCGNLHKLSRIQHELHTIHKQGTCPCRNAFQLHEVMFVGGPHRARINCCNVKDCQAHLLNLQAHVCSGYHTILHGIPGVNHNLEKKQNTIFNWIDGICFRNMVYIYG